MCPSWENSISLIVGTSVIGFLGFISALRAAAESIVTPENASASLDEIVVTASKRASTVQDTPISISAVSGDDLQARGVASLAALAQGTPGVSLKTEGPSQTEIEMRGMTSSGGNSATVGFYLDDIPLAGPASAQNGHVVIDPDLYDLNRIEILRGPQGTLFGSGSMGGTVRLITNQPNLSQFQSTAQSVLSGTDGGGFNHKDNLMINLPLIDDTLALRVVGTEDSERLDRSHRGRSFSCGRWKSERDRARQCPGRPDHKAVSGLERLSDLCGAGDSAVEADGKPVRHAVVTSTTTSTQNGIMPMTAIPAPRRTTNPSTSPSH